jgi:hypothetical protein
VCPGCCCRKYLDVIASTQPTTVVHVFRKASGFWPSVSDERAGPKMFGLHELRRSIRGCEGLYVQAKGSSRTFPGSALQRNLSLPTPCELRLLQVFASAKSITIRFRGGSFQPLTHLSTSNHSLIVSSLGLPRSRLSASIHRSLDTPGGLVCRKSRLLARPRRLTRAVRTARNDKVKGKANANN